MLEVRRNSVAGLCPLTTIFLTYKAETLRGWNVFDIMNAMSYTDGITRLPKQIGGRAGLSRLSGSR